MAKAITQNVAYTLALSLSEDERQEINDEINSIVQQAQDIADRFGAPRTSKQSQAFAARLATQLDSWARANVIS